MKSQWWGILWRSENLHDGKQRHLMGDGSHLPRRFRTRAEARQHVREEYGYIATRKDLRVEPHGWRMPEIVRIEITARRSSQEG